MNIGDKKEKVPLTVKIQLSETTKSNGEEMNS